MPCSRENSTGNQARQSQCGCRHECPVAKPETRDQIGAMDIERHEQSAKLRRCPSHGDLAKEASERLFRLIVVDAKRMKHAERKRYRESGGGCTDCRGAGCGRVAKADLI